ncbi:hypothetical protein SAMN05421810_106310 [Amycolatopsis arida]|uniref:Uncharacterized protein n=1 Tax=Amycolatopsis arida TaxID=587909 RepID=A0A1I5XXB7_9PSEU|nr:hypothetical protein CLV69_102312 [Amycolatopsis arida]SFQ36588.1 hypothetical protein SAMN05421810_106310 [Amycolatopsis arida]
MDDTLIIDCDRCAVRGDACADCVVSVLLGAPPAVEWDDDERRAIGALVEAGMVPRLRLVPTDHAGGTGGNADPAPARQAGRRRRVPRAG